MKEGVEEEKKIFQRKRRVLTVKRLRGKKNMFTPEETDKGCVRWTRDGLHLECSLYEGWLESWTQNCALLDFVKCIVLLLRKISR